MIETIPFTEAVSSRGSGTKGLPQSEWTTEGRYPVIGQGAEYVEGRSDREDLLLRPDPALVLYGGHTRRAKLVTKPFVPGPNVKILTPGPRIDAAYLYRFLEQLKIESRGYADHFPHVKRSSIPVPPLAEQRRIARILDAADALRVKRRESLAQLDTLLQSTFLDMFGDCDRPPISVGPPTFGSASRFVPLLEVARLATGHTPDRKKAEYWNGEIPWISLTDIRELDGSIAVSTLQNVTKAGIANSSAVVLPKGTVCFSRTATVGFVVVAGCELATSQDFVNWVCGERLNPVYLMWALRQARPYLLAKSSGSTHKTIYYRHAERFEVFLPPIELQCRFAALVNSVGRQRDIQRAHLDELDTLFASLQSRAFRDNL